MTEPITDAPAPLAADRVELQLATDITFSEQDDDRTFSAFVLPWNKATGDYRRLSFNEGSVSWDKGNVGRIKLLDTHNRSELASLLGVTVAVTNGKGVGLSAKFRMASTTEADRAWQLLKDGVLDGVSVGVAITSAKHLKYDEESNTMTVLGGAVLKEVSLVPIPAFEDARVKFGAEVEHTFALLSQPAPAALSDSPEGEHMSEQTPATTPAPAPTVDLAELGETMTAAVRAGNAELASSLGEAIVAGLRKNAEELAAANEGAAASPGGRVSATERPDYSFGDGDGAGHSWLRDLALAKYSGGTARDEAEARLTKFQGQLSDGTINLATETRSTLAPITPTVPRQDLYVEQLAYNRPLYDAVSKGPLNSAQPFTLPKWDSSANLSQDHTEGTNSTEGTIDFTTQTVTPGTVDGLFKASREVFESSTPQLDAIARRAMVLAYEEKIETRLYALLAAVNYANVSVENPENGDEGALLGTAIANVMVDQLFQAGGTRINRVASGKSPYKALVNAKDEAGRPLFPALGVQNSDGSKSAGVKALNVHGEIVVPAYSIPSGDASTGQIFAFNAESVHIWTSPLRMWRFEERGGPSIIELATFGYVASAVLRNYDVIEINLIDAV